MSPNCLGWLLNAVICTGAKCWQGNWRLRRPARKGWSTSHKFQVAACTYIIFKFLGCGNGFARCFHFFDININLYLIFMYCICFYFIRYTYQHPPMKRNHMLPDAQRFRVLCFVENPATASWEPWSRLLTRDPAYACHWPEPNPQYALLKRFNRFVGLRWICWNTGLIEINQ